MVIMMTNFKVLRLKEMNKIVSIFVLSSILLYARGSSFYIMIFILSPKMSLIYFIMSVTSNNLRPFSSLISLMRKKRFSLLLFNSRIYRGMSAIKSVTNPFSR